MIFDKLENVIKRNAVIYTSALTLGFAALFYPSSSEAQTKSDTNSHARIYVTAGAGTTNLIDDSFKQFGGPADVTFRASFGVEYSVVNLGFFVDRFHKTGDFSASGSSGFFSGSSRRESITLDNLIFAGEFRLNLAPYNWKARPSVHIAYGSDRVTTNVDKESLKRALFSREYNISYKKDGLTVHVVEVGAGLIIPVYRDNDSKYGIDLFGDFIKGRGIDENEENNRLVKNDKFIVGFRINW